MLSIEVLTLFPELLSQALQIGLLEKALSSQIISIKCRDIRDYAQNKYRRVDDTPYGGGPGMVMSITPIVRALEDIGPSYRLLLSPRGTPFKQEKAQALATQNHLTLICGRYEGIDERIYRYIDESLSIGDYVLSGGEYAALVVIDAVARLQPGFMGSEESLSQESFNNSNLLEYPQYTRPAEFRGEHVPDVLLSGDHEKIKSWRKNQAEIITKSQRPDLWKLYESTQDHLKIKKNK